jgi:hypothetical protein
MARPIALDRLGRLHPETVVLALAFARGAWRDLSLAQPPVSVAGSVLSLTEIPEGGK